MKRTATTTPALSAGVLIAILLLAANLRATLTGVGTLVPAIEADTGLTASAGGVLNTVPLLMFAVTSPFVGRVSHRTGTTRLVVAALAVLVLGTVIRSLPSIACLFAGTVLLSVAIAVGNVLLPTVIRVHVPADRVHTVSALYVTVMGLVAALSSGISVPLAKVLPGTWHSALAWGAIVALAALAGWLPRLREDRRDSGVRSGGTHARTPWRSWLAWQVSFFMGLQSLGFYTAIAWLPSILGTQGVSTTAAGWMLFYYQVVALLTGMVLPLLTRGRHDQRFLAAAASATVATGFAVLLFLPALTVVACTLLGLGTGVCLVLALSFQSQRATGASETTALAGMAQSVGYLVAAAGPLLLGVLHDTTGSWTPALLVLIGLSSAMAVAGYGAGRDRHVRSVLRTPRSAGRTPPRANGSETAFARSSRS
ncbi:CynX/NimT family MFS transporter [Amycolatopsis umgeniensis]|uniref:CP family cyanate transporter-like MFS transporter n=1 Tax=Amycolatopsis umgeniensis TaxID=336628 RepID=A0A841AXL1_9PSEU|nr:MFS transporter [Amycolatopsis umgeniensis]MBB5851250.1 CP family cyanate transporter-like MFS transporter [Amycolatopsis umgeniensis]